MVIGSQWYFSYFFPQISPKIFMSHSADSFRSHFSFSAFVYTHIHTTYTNGNDLKLNLTDAFRTNVLVLLTCQALINDPWKGKSVWSLTTRVLSTILRNDHILLTRFHWFFCLFFCAFVWLMFAGTYGIDHKRTWLVLLGDTPDVQIWASYLKAFESDMHVYIFLYRIDGNYKPRRFAGGQ